ncbi:MAG: hypothetical protein J3Q66DRAFT_407780 [Benniella sp.]|nr:MAG: hypothetical protein J3Q66DRAFT_407780 [Benniella sp.]
MATVDQELADFYQRLVHYPVSDCHDFDGSVWVLLITLLQDKFGHRFMNHIAQLYHLLSDSLISGNLTHIRIMMDQQPAMDLINSSTTIRCSLRDVTIRCPLSLQQWMSQPTGPDPLEGFSHHDTSSAQTENISSRGQRR